jgi:hypothetical protein
MNLRENRTNFVMLLLLAAVAGTVVYFDMTYAVPSSPIEEPYTPAMSITIGQTTVNVPNWQLFHDDGIWRYVSSTHTLNADFAPQLSDIPISHSVDATQIHTKYCTILGMNLRRIYRV